MSSSEFTSVHMRLRNEELAALDAYRRDQKSPPSTARAAEQLMRRGVVEHLWGKEANVAAA